jgi:pimeloyl-ACP methyl ester carboxylesterase
MPTIARGVLVCVCVVVCLLVLIIAVGLAYRALRQHENAQAFAIHTPHGIDEAGFVKIGGIDQWVTIRGEDAANPVILFVHGGPGLAISPLFAWFRPWEKWFTLVQWDQRGAGKTYGRYGKSTPDMSRDRIVSDGIELSEYLRRRLHHGKIIVLAHSWGASVGLVMVAGRPDLFSAYVGAGQVTGAAQEEAAHAMALAAARKAGDVKAIKAFETTRPPYVSADQMMDMHMRAVAYSPLAERTYVTRSAPTALVAPGYSLIDLFDNGMGGLFSIRPLFHDMTSFDARRVDRRFAVPMIFIQGELDNITPTPSVRA